MNTSIDVTRNKLENEPTCFLNLAEHGNILAVHFSPYEWSQDIILLAFRNKILVAQINYNDELDLKKIGEFYHSDVCTAMYLSPETSINVLPIMVQFCTAGNEDFLLRIFRGNISDENEAIVLSGHKNYVNDICYDADNQYIASVSDDNTAKVWGISYDYDCLATFKLTSPGMSAGWHREDNSKLMVAEKNGIIRFYNVNTQRPIISLDPGKSLSAAHWAPSNSQLVGSLNMGELVLWDVSKPSCPKHLLIYTQNGGHIKFSPQGELVATINKLDSTLKVTHLSSFQSRLSVKTTVPTNVTWHYRLPLLCMGDDTKLCFWKVISK